ncbi:MAG: photosystem II protein PsbQ [Leptolyngbyaceae bacterium]|nr:photosystem II protein PsbQ [Leptolyngbyaceae bacterium]
MTRYRSTLTLILVLITVFVVSFASPTFAAKAPTTYTPEQISQIQNAGSDVQAFRDRMPELANFIENREWMEVRSLIHGPFGELRTKMSRLARTLLPDAQKVALEASKNVFGHLEEIDEAAGDRDYRQAIRNYSEALKDFDTFFKALPNA